LVSTEKAMTRFENSILPSFITKAKLLERQDEEKNNFTTAMII
jgi:hypothetical protein